MDLIWIVLGCWLLIALIIFAVMPWLEKRRKYKQSIKRVAEASSKDYKDNLDSAIRNYNYISKISESYRATPRDTSEEDTKSSSGRR